MLFETNGAAAVELGNADIPRLQRFFVDNPEYFFAVNGAERFWERNGFAETRTRDGVVMGTQTNKLRVMVKPLAGGALNDYLTLVERDRF